MKQLLFICALLGLLSSCTQGLLHEEKKYTPLYLYYNPFKPSVGLTESMYSPEKDYPNYQNYPSDCVKHGLRERAALVSYIGRGIVYFELSFDKEGKLMRTVSSMDAARRFAEYRDFKYDSMGKLEGVYRQYGSRRQKLEYDASGKLVKREGGLSYAYQTYAYYDDGTLKEITPHMFNDHYLNYDFYGKMEFNESGELAQADFLTTPNPFWNNGRTRLRSVCAFSYVSNGLCTQKKEIVYPDKTHMDVDSIICRSVYVYNDKGDIARWDYSDILYQGATLENGNNLAFMFEYKYDRHGNWTTMKIILPEYYIGNRDALAVFAKENDMLGQLSMGSKELNEPAAITIERQIDYHALPASD